MQNQFKGKKVLITGHTGFKGSWLALWLNFYGAKVIGYSNKILTKTSNFKINCLNKKLVDIRGDINDKLLDSTIRKYKPDYIFHLAAQAVVSESKFNPKSTILTNILGAVNLFEILRNYRKKIKVVIITSDKCYENDERILGYNETDKLGGADIYSASKASVEICFHAYFQTFFKKQNNIKICTARAGNVIGGGDWTQDRLIPDCIKNWSNRKQMVLRSPNAVRPWQHVFEPLNGYIKLMKKLNTKINGKSFNFGPYYYQDLKVIEVVNFMKKNLTCFNNKKIKIKKNNAFNEKKNLKLSSENAYNFLKWKPSLTINESLQMTSDWFNCYFSGKEDIKEFSLNQIKEYEKKIYKK